jgi:hypothetical protein
VIRRANVDLGARRCKSNAGRAVVIECSENLRVTDKPFRIGNEIHVAAERSNDQATVRKRNELSRGRDARDRFNKKSARNAKVRRLRCSASVRTAAARNKSCANEEKKIKDSRTDRFSLHWESYT